MSVDIPSNFSFDLGVDLNISGIPTNYGIGITQIPKINVGLDTINFNLMPIEIKPIDFSIRLKEVPSLRVHFPVDYKVCLGLFGTEILNVRLCGQSQVITEPYIANPCECRPMPNPVPVPVPDVPREPDPIR